MKSAKLSLVFVIILLLICGCANKKKMVVMLPCEAETIDDVQNIRELGHGISHSLQSARNYAIHDAQHKIITRFCDSIRVFMPRVEYNPYSDSIFVGLEDTILFKYPMQYFGELSYTRKECEKVTYDSNNQYHCFITLALPKSDIKHAGNKVFHDFLDVMAEIASQSRNDKTIDVLPKDSMSLQ